MAASQYGQRHGATALLVGYSEWNPGFDARLYSNKIALSVSSLLALVV
jgi:hypothetical protein